MAWVRLDDKRATHRKLRAAGFEARGLDEAAICWCAHEETDGFLSDEDFEVLTSLHKCKRPLRLAVILVEVGRWRRDEKKNGWWIKDYLDYNPSHADLEDQRKRDRDRKKSRGNRADSTRNPSGTDAESDDLPATPTVPTDRPTDINPLTPAERGKQSLNPRAAGTNPRAVGTSSRSAAKRSQQMAGAVSFGRSRSSVEDRGDVVADIAKAYPDETDLRQVALDAWTGSRTIRAVPS